MSFHHQQIAPPKAWDEFEDLCLALFRAEWQDSAAQKNGRQGQKQAGVDVFGINHAQGGLWGVQCKGKNRGYGSKLTQKEIDMELAKADTFKPKLAHWIIATTAANDAALQEYARTLSAQRAARQLCPVDVFFWESIEALLYKHRDIAKIFYPDHFTPINPPPGPPAKPLRLPGISLSDFFADPLNHLAQLRQQLADTGSSALLAAATVQGMGGVGKTQLALKYSMAFQNDYAGVWWLQAETAAMLEQECTLFCHKQGVHLVSGEPPAAAMCAWLAGQSGWLLVYDNAEDEALLRACLPKGGAHHVLITSRLRAWDGMARLELDVWQEDEALQFLRPRLTGVADADDEQLRALTGALDGLPLALEQACAYIVKNRVSVAAYCQRIQAHEGTHTRTQTHTHDRTHDRTQTSAQHLLDKTDSPFCARSVLATLSLAFEKLGEPARRLLGLCAWLAAEPIPEYLFTELSEEWAAELASDLPGEWPPAMQTLAADEFAWRETVAELENHALCQVRVIRMADHVGNGAQDVRCLHFHRLTQAAVRARSQGAQAGAAALLLVWVAFPTDITPADPQYWPRCRTLAPHVQRVQACYQEGGQQAARHAWLLAQLATYLKYGPGLYQQVAPLERQALQILQNALGEEHPDTLATMNNLADSLRRMGELPGARALHEKTLAICNRVLGEAHPHTLASINNLAETLRHMGELPDARALHENALAICRRVLGEEHPTTLQLFNNLATTLLQMGELAEARALHEKVLAIRRRVLGETHPDTLISLNNLATILYHLGDLSDAQNLMEQAGTTLRQVLGEEHPDTITAKQNLAAIIAAQKAD